MSDQPMFEPCVELHDVFFSPDEVPLLQNINLSIPSGQCTVLMGPAGCGKSMVLKLAAGLLVPTSGSVSIQGSNWDQMSEHETIEVRSQTAFTFQNGALWANKSIYQNIELPLVFHNPKMASAYVKAKIEALCAQMGYKGDLRQRPSQLSLGEQKLISFIRALVIDPMVLFLDDPTSSLDAQTRDKVLSTLEEFRRKGRTSVLVTQDPTVTARLADYLVILKDGKVLTDGPFQTVTKSTDPEVIEILTSVLSQAATFSDDILDLLSGG